MSLLRSKLRLISLIRDNVVAVAAIVSCIVAVVTYLEWPIHTEPVPYSVQPNVLRLADPEILSEGVGSAPEMPTSSSSAPEMPSGSNVDSETDSSVAPPLAAELRDAGVVLGYSVEALRKANEVREMFSLEQGQELSSLRGVYGFIHYLSLSTMFSLKVDVSVKRVQNRKSVEVHKMSEGNVMLLVYVDESTATRLGSARGKVGAIFGFFRPFDKHTILAGLPTRRILSWEHRLGGEGGFAEIQID